MAGKIRAMAGRTVFTVLEETAKQYGDAGALHQPTGNKASRNYRTYSWNDWMRISREIALGLRALGLSKSEIVCILSETRAEFYLVDLGIMGAGGVAAALYTAYPMPDLARNIQQAEARFLFIEDAKTLAALTQAVEARGERLPEHVILMTGEQPGALSLQDLQKLGREALERDPAAFTRIQEEISATGFGNLVPDIGRNRRTEDGTDEPCGDSGEHRHGTGGAAHWTRGFDGCVSAVGAHRAAYCSGDGAAADGYAGLVLRKLGAIAGRTEIDTPDGIPGAAARVGKDVRDDPQ